MFGVIVSGRPVNTTATTVSPTQLAYTIPATPTFSHIVVFFLPGTSLPPDQAAAVYIQLPPSTDFKLLGAIANDKQSAIFRIRAPGAAGTASGPADDDAMVDDASGGPASGETVENITLGISVEPAAQVAQALAAQRANANGSGITTGQELVRRAPAVASSPVSTKILAQRIIANAYNFLASFSGTGSGGNEVVPLKSFQEWWKKFEKKVEMDPTFLERSDGD